MKESVSYVVAGLLIGVVLTTLVFAGWFRGLSRDAGQQTRSLSLSHPHPVTHPIHGAMEFFARRVDELSAGMLRIEIFPSSQLGNESKVIEQMQRGTVGFCVIGSATVGNFVPVARVFSLPYLFRDEDHYWQILGGPIGRSILEQLSYLDNGALSGLTGIEFFDAGSRNFYTMREVRSVADLRGLKIRVIAEPVCMDAVAAMGAAPTPVPWGELYTALQQGMVDGAENNLPSLLAARHGEVCRYFIATGHFRLPDVMLASAGIMESLSPAGRQWIREAATEALILQRQLWADMTGQAREELEAGGMIFVEPDVESFRAASRSAFEKHAGGKLGEWARRIQEEMTP